MYRLIAGVALLLLGGTIYLDGPPVAHTGGFGEPTCQMCHFGSELNRSMDALSIRGPAEEITPLTTYRLEIKLRSDNLVVGGFQMSSRTRSGQNVGNFRSPTVDTRVAVDTTGIQYVQHTQHGVENTPVSDNQIGWTVEWISPDVIPDTIVFNVAANAANGDNSALGDVVYVREVVVASGVW